MSKSSEDNFFRMSEFFSCVIEWRRLAINPKLLGVVEALFLSYTKLMPIRSANRLVPRRSEKPHDSKKMQQSK
jgi:hypothetical protein